MAELPTRAFQDYTALLYQAGVITKQQRSDIEHGLLRLVLDAKPAGSLAREIDEAERRDEDNPLSG